MRIYRQFLSLAKTNVHNMHTSPADAEWHSLCSRHGLTNGHATSQFRFFEASPAHRTSPSGLTQGSALRRQRGGLRTGGFQAELTPSRSRWGVAVSRTFFGVVLVLLILSIAIASVLGFLTASLFIRVGEICPDFFDCEDATSAAWIFAALTVLAAIVSVVLTWVLKKLARPSQIDR